MNRIPDYSSINFTIQLKIYLADINYICFTASKKTLEILMIWLYITELK